MSVYCVKRVIVHIMLNVIVEKLCKGIRGLRAHQWFCTISDIPELRKLFNEEIITNGEYLNNENFEEATFTPQAKLPTPGLKLPKTNESWNQANKFFKSTLDVNKEIICVNDICHPQDTFLRIFQKRMWNCFRKWHIR